MTKKAWIYILIFLVLLFGLPFLFHEEKKDDDEMNSKEINESTPLLQQDFRVDFSPPQNDSDPLSDSVELSAKDIVINFFGYLKAGEFENAATFFYPDLYLDYFYADSHQREERIKQFGLMMTNRLRLMDIEIVDLQYLRDGYDVTVKLKFLVGDPQTIHLKVIPDQDLHDGHPIYWIHTPVDQLLSQLE